MEQLKMMKEQLMAQVQAQMGDLKCVDTHELGEVIDMIKDLAQTMYYCEIQEQMKKAAEKEEEQPTNNNYYYTERYYPTPGYYRDMGRRYGKMYYPEGSDEPYYYSQSGGGNSGGNSGGGSSSNSGGSGNYYTERDYPLYLHDEREGRSPMKRKMYMEAKDTNQDTSKSMKELESYMQELTSDMMELLGKASPEEKAMVQKRVNTLAAKIQNV